MTPELTSGQHLPVVHWHPLRTCGYVYYAVADGKNGHPVAWISLKKPGDLYLARYSDGHKPVFEAKVHTLANAQHYIATLFAKFKP
jgi:hypothetical protein